MADFQFVNVSHPAEIKERRHQHVIRASAIRNSSKESRNKAVRNHENFIVVEGDPHTKNRASEGRQGK
jgi:hypothetical protein